MLVVQVLEQVQGLFQVLEQGEVQGEEQEKQVTAHHTLHWKLDEPPAKSSIFSKWVFCVTIDARVVALMVGG